MAVATSTIKSRIFSVLSIAARVGALVTQTNQMDVRRSDATVIAPSGMPGGVRRLRLSRTSGHARL
jgi:hypothetical protein